MTPNELVEKYAKFALAAANDWCQRRMLKGALVDDFKAESLTILWSAAQRYDPTKGMSFSNYAYHRIRWGLGDMARQLGGFRRKRRNPVNIESLDASVDPTPIQEYPSALMAKLGPQERLWAQLTLKDWKGVEICKMLGVRKSTIYERKRIARRQLGKKYDPACQCDTSHHA